MVSATAQLPRKVTRPSRAPRPASLGPQPPSEVRAIEWVVSLLFWAQLLVAAVLYASVALAPKVTTLLDLSADSQSLNSQLVALERQVTDMKKVTEALEHDPRVLEELARLNLDVTRPGEESIPVGPDLMLQNEMTRARSYQPEVVQPWYATLIEAFAKNQRLRHTLLFVSAALVLVSFTFFHASQVPQFSSGLKNVRDGATRLSTRYRRIDSRH
ncbi:hypothetical protein GC176_11665 [bacterium]|nr:hypothetical protein [bacterium]